MAVHRPGNEACWCYVPGAIYVRANGPVDIFRFRGTRMLSARDTSKIRLYSV